MASADRQMPRDTLGRYRVLEPIGEGGMAVIHRGEHVALGRAVAIKLLHPRLIRHPSMARRFQREAETMGGLRHPGIVEVLDAGTSADGRAFVVMELLRGETLATRMRHRLPEEQVIAFGRQLASALGAAHERGVIHRDLKPDNIFVISDPEIPGGERVKLLDFGIAKRITGELSEKTKTGVLLGTPAYMAPEQCIGAQDVDGRADIYALGIVLYLMATASLPFDGGNTDEILAEQLYCHPRPVCELAPVSRQLAAIVSRCLAKAPADRYQTMAELGDALAELAQSGPTTVAEPAELRRAPASARQPVAVREPVAARRQPAIIRRDQVPARPAALARVRATPTDLASGPVDQEDVTARCPSPASARPSSDVRLVSLPSAEGRLDALPSPDCRLDELPSGRPMPVDFGSLEGRDLGDDSFTDPTTLWEQPGVSGVPDEADPADATTARRPALELEREASGATEASGLGSVASLAPAARGNRPPTAIGRSPLSSRRPALEPSRSAGEGRRPAGARRAAPSGHQPTVITNRSSTALALRPPRRWLAMMTSIALAAAAPLLLSHDSRGATDDLGVAASAAPAPVVEIAEPVLSNQPSADSLDAGSAEAAPRRERRKSHSKSSRERTRDRRASQHRAASHR